MADAQVTLTNIDTAEKRFQRTDPDGLYSFVNLVPGKYRVEVEKAGFKRTSRLDVIVEVQQTARIDLRMQVGDVRHTVEVTEETPSLQPQTSSPAHVVEELNANQLALNR